MLKGKHILLVLALIALAVGFLDARGNIIFYLGPPVGVALFGLFLIAQVLEKESALYDEQNRAPEEIRLAQLQNPLSQRQEVAHDPALAMARPH
jgi:hypothetical protein